MPIDSDEICEVDEEQAAALLAQDAARRARKLPPSDMLTARVPVLLFAMIPGEQESIDPATAAAALRARGGQER